MSRVAIIVDDLGENAVTAISTIRRLTDLSISEIQANIGTGKPMLEVQLFRPDPQENEVDLKQLSKDFSQLGVCYRMYELIDSQRFCESNVNTYFSLDNTRLRNLLEVHEEEYRRQLNQSFLEAECSMSSQSTKDGTKLWLLTGEESTLIALNGDGLFVLERSAEQVAEASRKLLVENLSPQVVFAGARQVPHADLLSITLHKGRNGLSVYYRLPEMIEPEPPEEPRCIAFELPNSETFDEFIKTYQELLGSGFTLIEKRLSFSQRLFIGAGPLACMAATYFLAVKAGEFQGKTFKISEGFIDWLFGTVLGFLGPIATTVIGSAFSLFWLWGVYVFLTRVKPKEVIERIK